MNGERKRVCVVGAGLSGLAAVRGLREGGHEVTCYEAGSEIGGMWRYGNDNGVSAAYASLTANTSYRRMQYPSFPDPDSMAEFPHRSELVAYLERYAQANGLHPHITCGARVERARVMDGGWEITVRGAEPEQFDALVVASGHYWDPEMPALPGRFDGTILHARDYDEPHRFAGQLVVVVGSSQSALDIAAEVSTIAHRTILSSRQGHHLIPRHLFGRPFDDFDTPAALLVTLPVVRLALRAQMWVARATPDTGDLPPPHHRLFESRWPVVVSPTVQRAIKEQAFGCRPEIRAVDGDRVEFADGSEARTDAIVFATGYRINFPFLAEHLGRGEGLQFPLYRRILSPHAGGLAFIGILEPGPGLLEIVERQAEWLAEALAGRLALQDPKRMWRTVNSGGERRSRRQFYATGPHTILCNRHAYLRVLARDLRRGRSHGRNHVRRAKPRELQHAVR